MEPRSGDKRRVLADELRDRSSDRRAGGRSRRYRVDGLVVPRRPAACRFLSRFTDHLWPGRRLPELYYNPRNLAADPRGVVLAETRRKSNRSWFSFQGKCEALGFLGLSDERDVVLPSGEVDGAGVAGPHECIDAVPAGRTTSDPHA